jgi:hypothetical protein
MILLLTNCEAAMPDCAEFSVLHTNLQNVQVRW